MKNVKLFLPIGLPGSGKTYYGKSICKNNFVEYFDGDLWYKNNQTLDEIISEVRNILETGRSVYMDGLYITEKVIDKILDIKSPLLKINICITYYSSNEEDRKNCLINDKIRSRDKSSENTIIHAPRPFMPLLNDSRVFNLNNLPVENYDFIDGLVTEADIYSTKSEEFTTEGSTYGTCWDEDGPADMGTDYDDYDLFNENSFKEVLKIFDLKVFDLTRETQFQCKHIVESLSDSEGDYYGGCRYYDYYEYNLKDMIKCILKFQFNIEEYTKEYIEEKIPERFL
jgi:hypothetical protein